MKSVPIPNRRDPRRLRPAACALAAALLAPIGAAAPAAETGPSSTEPSAAWPDTAPGRLAREWVEAFDAGEPAMRRYLAERLAEKSLAKKGVDARLQTYREMREQLGALTLARVHEERAESIEVALADAEGREHDFTFELEPSPGGSEPAKLASITARLRVGHSPFGH